MAKRGPKPKFDAPRKAKVIASLRRGLSLADALLAHGVTRQMYRTAIAADPEFNHGVKSAAALGKDYHLSRVEAGEERWQASAWFLERKYGAEYGQKVKLEHGGRIEVVEEVVSHAGQQTAAHTNGHSNGSPGAGRVPGL